MDAILLVEERNCKNNLMHDVCTGVFDCSYRFIGQASFDLFDVSIKITLKHEFQSYINVSLVFTKVKDSYYVWVVIFV